MNAQLKEIIQNSQQIVFFGGAGVSTESNIPDFQSLKTAPNTDYYLRHEYLLSLSCFKQEPKRFYDYYKKSLIHLTAKPNLAHLALARLEKQGKLHAIITQNVDNLHQQAGSKKVIELHGSVYRNYCPNCQKFFDVNYILASPAVPYCDNCQSVIKPEVVLYEEALDGNVLNQAIKAISSAKVLIVGGTSLLVYPAAGLINYFTGDKLIIINETPTPYDQLADLKLTGSIGQILDSAIAH